MNSIDEIIKKLEVIIKDCQIKESPLGYFAALYYNVTVTVKEKLGTDYFDDDERMEKLDVVFATRYIEAYEQFKKNEDLSMCWKFAFDNSLSKDIVVLQHLLLGMNAHINLDLGIAAAQISEPGNLDNLESDFKKINELLGSLVDEVQNDLAQIWPFLLKILKILKNVDDFVVNFSMKVAREEAWKFAKSLENLKSLELKKAINIKDEKAVKLSRRIIGHRYITGLIFKKLSAAEKGLPSEKIDTLMKKK